MKCVNQIFCSEIEVSKSIFKSYLVPYQAFDNYLLQVRQQHPKATHIVWAYRYLNEFDQIVENQTDDHEPKGCAGPPTLNVLRGNQLVNTAVITVRYFGGIKLGTGGMVRGYSDSVKRVIESAQLAIYQKLVEFCFFTNFSDVRVYEHYFKSKKIDFSNRDFGADGVNWKLMLTQAEITELKKFMLNE